MPKVTGDRWCCRWIASASKNPSWDRDGSVGESRHVTSAASDMTLEVSLYVARPSSRFAGLTGASVHRVLERIHRGSGMAPRVPFAPPWCPDRAQWQSRFVCCVTQCGSMMEERWWSDAV